MSAQPLSAEGDAWIASLPDLDWPSADLPDYAEAVFRARQRALGALLARGRGEALVTVRRGGRLLPVARVFADGTAQILLPFLAPGDVAREPTPDRS